MTPQAAGPEAREPSSALETLLRDVLAVEARAAVPYGTWPEDPWLRVDRAHRRNRARRRAGVAAVLTIAVAAAGGVLAAGPLDRSQPRPAQTTAPPPQDSWQALDDGRPRGEPVDEATRAAVAAAMLRPRPGFPDSWTLAHPATLRFLWNGTLGGRRMSLVRGSMRSPADAVTERLVWVGQEDPGGDLVMLRQYDSGPAVAAIPYRDGERGMRLLGVVRRGATAATTRAVLHDDGTVEEDWTEVPVRDGVVDAPMGEPLTYAPLELRVTVRGRATQYAGAGEWGVGAASGEAALPLTEADVALATADARGDLSRPAVRADVRTAIEMLLGQMASDAAHVRPSVLWAGPSRTGESMVAVTAGYPGQGRVLLVCAFGGGGGGGFVWWYNTTLPVSPVVGLDRPVAWRVPLPFGDGSRQVLGWLLPRGAGTPEVSVPGGGRRSPWTGDGIGMLQVGAQDTVRLRIPDAAGRVLLDRTFGPADAEPQFDPGRHDRFPPGGGH